jgi:hypothetical protein
MDLNFNKNEDHNKLYFLLYDKKLSIVKLGGGEKRIQKLHNEGKMTESALIICLTPKLKVLKLVLCW